MKKQLLGLDIGATSIRAASLKKEGNNFLLDSVIVAPSALKGVLSESLLDQQMMADAIKEALKKADIKNQEINISIPENQVYTKIIEMPQLSEQELAAALKWEIDQYIPLPRDKVRTDWQILEKRELNGKKTMNVLLVAAPIQLIDKYEKILNMAGIQASSIETEMIAVHRALYPLVKEQTSSIIVHLGSSTTNIAVIRNGVINMILYTNLGGASITRAVATDLGIDSQQAEDLKKAYGLNQDVFQGKVGKSLDPILNEIGGDIKKTMLLFKEKYENEKISQIILSGGTSLLPGLDVYFTNSLNTQVVIGNCWENYKIQNIPDQLKADFPSYNVVIGLALRNLV